MSGWVMSYVGIVRVGIVWVGNVHVGIVQMGSVLETLITQKITRQEQYISDLSTDIYLCIVLKYDPR